MVCIYCGSETKVTNSRHQKRSNNVWRRRECLNCGNIFTSIETADFATSVMVQTGKALQPFSREKLFISVYEAVRHRKTATTDATALTSTILGRLLSQISAATLQRQHIVNSTSEVLKRFDKAAYVQYLAYHPL